MEIKVDFTKSAQENASAYYEKSKRLLHKREKIKEVIKDLEARLEEARKNDVVKERKIIKVRSKDWYEKFHWFFTSNGMLAIGGRDAHQNEFLNSRHFSEHDLFFHSDIFGASVVILQGGADAPHEIRNEVAQFAACFSSAWQKMQKSVDVYAMNRDQVSKSTSQGSLGTGSFMLKGERDWYRNTELELFAFVEVDKLKVVPKATLEKLKIETPCATIVQGKMKKSDAAKRLSALLHYSDLDVIMQQLPTGTFDIELKKD